MDPYLRGARWIWASGDPGTCASWCKSCAWTWSP